MHHFKWSPGDYARRTVGLTPMQDLAYRRMLDRYYLDEAPLKGEAVDVAESIGLYNRDDPDEAALKAVKTILRRFFDWRDDRFHNRHADEVIDDYRKHLKQGSDGGKRSGETRRANALAKKAAAADQAERDAVGATPTPERTPSKSVGQTPTKIEATRNQKPETNTPPIAKAMPPPSISPAVSDKPKPVVPASPPPEPEKAAETPAAPTPSPKSKKAGKQPENDLAGAKTPMGRDYVPPDWVPKQEWRDFVEHRLAMKQVPFTAAAAKVAVDNLERCRTAGHDPAERLRDAVARGWRTVFPPDVRPAAPAGYKTAAEKKADAGFAASQAIRDYALKDRK